MKLAIKFPIGLVKNDGSYQPEFNLPIPKDVREKPRPAPGLIYPSILITENQLDSAKYVVKSVLMNFLKEFIDHDNSILFEYQNYDYKFLERFKLSLTCGLYDLEKKLENPKDYDLFMNIRED